MTTGKYKEREKRWNAMNDNEKAIAYVEVLLKTASRHSDYELSNLKYSMKLEYVYGGVSG